MSLTPAAVRALEAYGWPGNVREMENVIERSIALGEGEVIDRQDLPKTIGGEGDLGEVVPCPQITAEGIEMGKTIEAIERGMIRQALDLSGGVKSRAASLLGLNRTTLVEKIKRLRMEGDRSP